MSEGLFDRYPQCAEFAEIFDWLRSLEVSADVAAEVSRSLLWAGGRAKRKGSSGGAVEAGRAGRPRALSLEQVAEIQAAHASWDKAQGSFTKAMATRFGVSEDTVQRVANKSTQEEEK